jgi:UDP-N-acetylglucosamine--N-acetylmuramyl-(pentapeptide) pyrophosphoryl-undecaprenol N-acetylglucosamine transferase
MMSPALSQRILIMAGGTGGHVYPALAVAEDLRRRGYGVTWLGTRKGIEARVVPEKNIPILFIASVGVRGKGIVNACLAPWIMLKGFLQTLVILLRVKPAVVLGMGGFVSVPGGIASWILRKPLVIHEQNAVAGTANRLLSHFALRVLTGFDHVLPKGERVGNPVRREIAQLPPKAIERAPGSRLNVLVLGGSLGAQAINEVLPLALKQFTLGQRPKVWHQTGSTTYESTLALYQQQQLVIDGEQLKVTAFIDDMASAYAWADLILCRAGAITLAEVMCVGLPAILVPLPNAIDDHQSKNAGQLSDAGAVIVVPQSQLSADGLTALLVSLATDTARLQRMVRAARELAMPDAAKQVADICLEVSRGGACG